MAIIGFDTTVFPFLDFRDHDSFWREVEEIRDLFERHEDLLEPVRRAARGYKHAFDILDPFIQSYTSRVCPYCGTVCCANKHGFPEYADIVGILAMGLEIPRYRLDVDEGALCQFIGERGCTLPRARRPYRCTWYFCDPLLVQIELGPARDYNTFIRGVQGLAEARGDMLRAFYPIWKDLAKAGKAR